MSGVIGDARLLQKTITFNRVSFCGSLDRVTKSKEEQKRIYDEYMTYTMELSRSGKMVACVPLDPTATATTIRLRDGKTIPTDGPFADTKEQLGGTYVIDVKDLNEAIEWAKRIPDARHGSIEIRPLMNVPEL